MGLEVIDGTPTAISKYLREREVKMKITEQQFEILKRFADRFDKTSQINMPPQDMQIFSDILKDIEKQNKED